MFLQNIFNNIKEISMIQLILYIMLVYGDNTSDMIKLTNIYRRMHGLKELRTPESLRLASQLQANTMCKEMKMTHSTNLSNRRTLRERLEYFNFKGFNIGENIAKQQNDDFKEVFKVWSKSDLHKKNLLGDYNSLGISTCKGEDNNRYWVQVFGKGYINWRGSKYNYNNFINENNNNFINEDKNSLMDENKNNLDEPVKDNLMDENKNNLVNENKNNLMDENKNNLMHENDNTMHENKNNLMDENKNNLMHENDNSTFNRFPRSITNRNLDSQDENNIIFLIKDTEDIEKIRKSFSRNMHLNYQGTYKKYEAVINEEENNNLSPVSTPTRDMSPVSSSSTKELTPVSSSSTKELTPVSSSATIDLSTSKLNSPNLLPPGKSDTQTSSISPEINKLPVKENQDKLQEPIRVESKENQDRLQDKSKENQDKSKENQDKLQENQDKLQDPIRVESVLSKILNKLNNLKEPSSISSTPDLKGTKMRELKNLSTSISENINKYSTLPVITTTVIKTVYNYETLPNLENSTTLTNINNLDKRTTEKDINNLKTVTVSLERNTNDKMKDKKITMTVNLDNKESTKENNQNIYLRKLLSSLLKKENCDEENNLDEFLSKLMEEKREIHKEIDIGDPYYQEL